MPDRRIMAKGSMTREAWRCQPCHDRVSLWSRPSSSLAVSTLSSIARRWPSIVTRVRMPVPAGHHVVKKARSSSLICGGSEGPGSTALIGFHHIRRRRDRRVRNSYVANSGYERTERRLAKLIRLRAFRIARQLTASDCRQTLPVVFASCGSSRYWRGRFRRWPST